MAITFVGNVDTAATSTSVTVSVPSAKQANDVAILVVSSYVSANQTHATPSGWTHVGGAPSAHTSVYGRLDVYRKVLTGGESSVSVSNSKATNITGMVQVFRGVDTTSPIESSSVLAGATSSLTGSWVGGFTPEGDGRAVLSIASPLSTWTSLTTAWSGSRNVQQGSPYPHLGMARIIQTTAASVANATWVVSTYAATWWIGGWVVLKPEPEASPKPPIVIMCGM